MHREGGTTEGKGMYPSLMRAWNPALSLRTTACPVEDSSPRWSNSHALTRDPRGGRHLPGTPLVLVRKRRRTRRRRPREHLSWSPGLSRLHRDIVLSPRSQDQRDHCDPIVAAGVCIVRVFHERIDGDGSIIGTRRGSRVYDRNFRIAA